MPIAAFAAFSLVQHLYGHELALFVPGDDHLCDALSVVHDEIFLREVYQQHAHLSAIVGIHRTRRVQHRDPFLQGQSAARSHLSLVACRQGDVQPCRDESPLHGLQHHGRIQISPQVHARTLRRSILRQWLMTLVHDFDL